MLPAPSLAEIKTRTCKRRDSWWTVLLVDPFAVRLVRLVYRFDWVTPNRVTLAATLSGLAAAYAFWQGAFVAGAALFYLGFLFDCVDGKIARLKGNGSAIGAWLEFVGDRIRFLVSAGALFAGLFRETQQQTYLWIGVAVIVLDLLHYLNGAEIHQLTTAMQQRSGISETASLRELAPSGTMIGLFRRISATMERFRIRPRLFSGIELEQIICVVAPLTGAIVTVATVAIGLHLLFEAAVIVLFIRTAANLRQRSKEAVPVPAQRSSLSV